MKRILPILLALGAVTASTGRTETNDVAFSAACDGTEQRYVLMLPAGYKPGQPHDLLMALHGHGSDRWQFARDKRDECRAARDVAAAHNMIYVSPDYRAKTSWMGPKAEADVVQIIGDLKRRHHIRHVFICGGSMGGTSALTLAALHSDLVDGVAAMNGTANHVEYANFQDAIAASFGGSKTDVPDEYRKRSAELNSPRLTMPVGLTVGGKDSVVPPQSVLRLAGVAKAVGRPILLLHRESRGHSTDYDDAKAILEFVIREAGNTLNSDSTSGLKGKAPEVPI
jgi:pimeloyl-ACP methyl ester carboxylesterase